MPNTITTRKARTSRLHVSYGHEGYTHPMKMKKKSYITIISAATNHNIA